MDNKFIEFLKKYKLAILGLILGAIGGFLYWHFIGCASGACPITGNPYISTGYGAVLGVLLFTSISKKSK